MTRCVRVSRLNGISARPSGGLPAMTCAGAGSSPRGRRTRVAVGTSRRLRPFQRRSDGFQPDARSPCRHRAGGSRSGIAQRPAEHVRMCARTSVEPASATLRVLESKSTAAAGGGSGMPNQGGAVLRLRAGRRARDFHRNCPAALRHLLCRRPAGAHHPAPPAGAPSRPEPRTGHLRAGRSRQVTALALGARRTLGPFADAPAAAQTYQLTLDLNLLTGLPINDGVRDLTIQPNAANAVGYGGPYLSYAVQLSPGEA